MPALLASCQYGAIESSGPAATLEIAVYSEDGEVLEGAQAYLDGTALTTDGSGRALFESAQPGLVTVRVNKEGYAPNIVRAFLDPSVQSSAEVKLLGLGEPIRADADEAVDINLGHQVRVRIPSGSLVDARGRPVSGKIQATVAAVDPMSERVAAVPPLRGRLEESGEEAELYSLLVAEISLWRDGERLNLALGRTASVEMVLPPALEDAYEEGDRIAAWWFDTHEGLWREDGSGVITRSTLSPGKKAWIADVGHFTFWSPSAPVNLISLDCVVPTVLVDNLDGTFSPVSGVRIDVEGKNYNHVGGYGITTPIGATCLNFKRGEMIRLNVSHPAGYHVANGGDFFGTGNVGSPRSCSSGPAQCATRELIVTLCGNGTVNGIEQCDDGNSSNFDGCVGKCVAAKCGDGFTRSGTEQCDDGNANNTDACVNQCKTAYCGDGFVWQGVEQCDDGNQVNTDACVTGCVTAKCGDGFVQQGMEACDDGNANNTDTCTTLCKNATCGDGFKQGGEECDDGNNVNTDLCVAGCKLAKCGDGYVGPGESCDDGNMIDGDTCSNSCKAPLCGNGMKEANEQCDDGNQVNTDGCTVLCKFPACGDGWVQAGEVCDDGNQINTDTCTTLCKPPFCGDAFLQNGEECDDGNPVNTDACTTQCKNAKCGDAFVQIGEECDDGNAVSTDACTTLCKNAKCGDTFVRTGVEECDDGNAINTDACTTQCKNAKCGDAFVWSGVEACDDGNQVAGDGCTSCMVSGSSQWVSTYNDATGSNDQGENAAFDGDGNVLVVGEEYTAAGFDILVRKLNGASGMMAWTKSYSGPSGGDDYGYGVAADSAGNVLVTGATFVSGQGYNVWIRKLSKADGSTLWTDTYDNSGGSDVGYDIMATTGDSVVLAAVVTVNGQSSVRVCKYNANGGAPVWCDITPGNPNYLFGSLDVVSGAGPSYDIFVTGYEATQGGVNDKIWTLKYAQNGGVLWKKSFVGSYYTRATTSDAAGNVYATGYRTVAGQQDNVLVVKYDTLGAVQWSHMYNGGSNGSDRGQDIALGPTHLLVTGYESVVGNGKNLWVGKYNLGGVAAWTRLYAGAAGSDDLGLGVGTNLTGDVIVTGYESTSQQGTDIWTSKLVP